jgi:hypothetical protein
MAGGILNLVAYGNQNTILTGNPTKTLFKCTYAKYTNFGLQRFRLDYDGLRSLHLDTTSQFEFKVSRYADLLMDTYLVVNLPHIWSPIMTDNNKDYPYEFKWIENIGTQMIERVRFTVGGQIIQDYTGEYLCNLVERDFSAEKKDLYYKMTGNINELTDPENATINYNKNINQNTYPNARGLSGNISCEPSIYGRKIYVPLNIWFTLAAKMAFPLVSLQYNEMRIIIDIRPVKELFVIRNIPTSEDTSTHHRQPNFTKDTDQFYRFVHPPPSTDMNSEDYLNKKTEWNADVHLIATYAFLTDEENRVFAASPQSYLVKQSYTHIYNNITGPKKIALETMGMVSSWMWFFRRNDSYMRNEWSNHSNWMYKSTPDERFSDVGVSGNYTTVEYNPKNEKNIMKSCAILFDGKYRENVLDSGVYNYIEKYTRTAGSSEEGLYCYNFCTSTDPYEYQPCGAINLSKFNLIEFEINVIKPPLDDTIDVQVLCDDDGNIIGSEKPVHSIFEYSYDMIVHEERYNILQFSSGNASLMYAR